MCAYCLHYIPYKLGKNNHFLTSILLFINMVHFTFTTYLTFSFLIFHRATVKKGVTFRTATPSNSLLWDITLDMGADGAIAVICQRKAPIPGKRQVCFLLIMFYHCVLPMCIFNGLNVNKQKALLQSNRNFSCTVGCKCL